jgi:FtsP/CotA-like multicopper oxidase with cupredoxin domain
MSARRRASLGLDESRQGQQEQPVTRNCDLPERDARIAFIKVRHKGQSAIGWAGWLIVCSFSLLAPSAFLFLHTFRQQTGSPTIFDDAYNEHEGQSQGYDFAIKVNPTQAEQLDLQTGFVISSEPTTREYVLNLTRENYAPDGFEKPMILVNGQSPGPLIEANTGDVLRITVNNFMPDASTTVHWHGIDQRNTSWMDGAYGISQCGIPPGGNFTYRFNVTGQRGTFWYHSHVSAQYTDGLYGPLVRPNPKCLYCIFFDIYRNLD